MRIATDSRILRTKQALTDAMLDILSEKSYTQITINELCDRANIRRATFYKHFKDKDDFLFFVVKELRQRFDTTVWKKETPQTAKDYYVSYAIGLINFLWDHKALAGHILDDSNKGHIIGMLIHQNFDDTKTRLDQSVKEGMSLVASTDTVAGILAGGVGMLIINWFIDGCLYPKEKLIDEISRAIERLLS